MTTVDIATIVGRVGGALGIPFPNTSVPTPAIVTKVGGPKGLPFNAKTDEQEPSVFGEDFTALVKPEKPNYTQKGTKLYSINNLGALVFMPVFLNGYEIPNALVSFSGEKGIVETDLIDVGTVFEKVYDRPYDITIIATVFGDNGEWPEQAYRELLDAYQADQVVTMECALTDHILAAQNNFLITKVSVPEMEGIENCQVVQFEGRSNVEFELEII